MKKFTLWLFHLFVREAEDIEDPNVRAKYGLFGGWFSIILNTVLFAIKLVIGILASSLALVADAFHSLSDTATSVVVIVGFQISKKPPDVEHPYGHGRAEYIATLIISVLLVVIGIEFIRSSVQQILEPGPVRVNVWILLAVVLTIVIKEGMGRVTSILGKIIDSDALQADSWHHRTDALSSVLVLFALVGGMFGLPALDGFGGLGVAALLIYTGYRIARNAIDTLLGKPPTPEMVEQIRSLARSVDHVVDAHDITVHSYGHHRYINLHVEVDEREDSMTLHDTAEQVEELLRHKLRAYALVHLDPISLESAEVERIRQTMGRLCREEENLLSYHELRLFQENDHHKAVMDVMLKQGLPDDAAREFLSHLKERLEPEFPGMEFQFRVTPIHRYK